MTAISNNEIARAIYLDLKDKSPKDRPEALQRVVEFLNRKHLLSKASLILSSLEKIINQEERQVAARVTSAKKLSEKVRHELVQNLKKRYSAKEIVLNEILDERLLGGVRIEVNDEVIDLSIRNKMKKLQEYLTRLA